MKLESKFAIVTFVAVFGAAIGVLAALDDESSNEKTTKVEVSRDDTSTTTIEDSRGNDGGSGTGKGSGKSGSAGSGGGSGIGGGGSGQTSESTLPLGITSRNGVPLPEVTAPPLCSDIALPTGHGVPVPTVLPPCP